MCKVTDANALMTMRSQGNVKQQTHRNCKAGEFRNQLHEDMTLDDADLADYPTNVAMIAAWDAGKNEATADGERLGMKHVNVTDEMWSSPWKWDPKNPRVPHVDECVVWVLMSNGPTTTHGYWVQGCVGPRTHLFVSAFIWRRKREL